MVSCFSSQILFFTHCAQRCASLTVVDHVIGPGRALTCPRLGAQVVNIVIRTFCTMLQTTNFPYEVVGNDSAYFLNCETLFCNLFTHRRKSYNA